MIKASYKRHLLEFKRPSGTSRGVLTQKETWYLILEDGDQIGYGECGLLRGLSVDDLPNYEEKLIWVCEHIDLGLERLYGELYDFPSIQFGLEQAFRSLESEDPMLLFPSPFTRGERQIPINGLVWMGDREFMRTQIIEKLDQGFDCIKMKIGAIDFKTELELLGFIRKEFSASQIEIRVDANGAFTAEEALTKLQALAALDLHSIEQPIKAAQWQEMAKLCETTPLPIALDEELIGTYDVTKKQEMLLTINPQYIILKPSLIGGFKGAQEWIDLATKNEIGWWVTSALESNIGLNAIAQWTFGLGNPMPQGLGTGSLYTNNIESPLWVQSGVLGYDPIQHWKLTLLD